MSGNALLTKKSCTDCKFILLHPSKDSLTPKKVLELSKKKKKGNDLNNEQAWPNINKPYIILEEMFKV